MTTVRAVAKAKRLVQAVWVVLLGRVVDHRRRAWRRRRRLLLVESRGFEWLPGIRTWCEGIGDWHALNGHGWLSIWDWTHLRRIHDRGLAGLEGGHWLRRHREAIQTQVGVGEKG